jgi:hypothetical protein
MITTPPPDFPLYGLEWRGTRALDWLCVLRRNGVITTYGVWLAHLANSGGVRVGTFSTAVLRQEDLTAAQHGVHSLLDITMPPGVPLDDMKTVAANAVPSWSDAEWTVDGRPVPARVWRFSGAWTGWTDLGEVSVAVVGIGDHEIHLRQTDGRPCGLQPKSPIDRAHHRGEQRAWHETLLPQPNPHWHADQLALLTDVGPND